MASDTPLDGRCGSPLRRKPGKFCTEYPLKGKKRCGLHGGKSRAAGPGHQTYTHGRYSKALPKEFQSRIGQILADKNLRKIGRDLAVNQVLIDDGLRDYVNATTQADRGKAAARIASLTETRDALLSGEVRRYSQMRDTMRVPEVMTMLGAMAAAVRSTAMRWQGDGKMQDVEGYLAVVDDQFRRLRAGSVRALALTVKAEGDGVTA
jgi:hypothetical protein